MGQGCEEERDTGAHHMRYTTRTVEDHVDRCRIPFHHLVRSLGWSRGVVGDIQTSTKCNISHPSDVVVATRRSDVLCCKVLHNHSSTLLGDCLHCLILRYKHLLFRHLVNLRKLAIVLPDSAWK